MADLRITGKMKTKLLTICLHILRHGGAPDFFRP